MLAQRLRHSVTLQSRATSLDAYGQNVGTWSNFATVRAGIEPIGGTEAMKAGQNVAEQNVRIVMRWIPGVTEQMRVLWGAVYYEIVAVAAFQEARRMIELTCRRGRSES